MSFNLNDSSLVSAQQRARPRRDNKRDTSDGDRSPRPV